MAIGLFHIFCLIALIISTSSAVAESSLGNSPSSGGGAVATLPVEGELDIPSGEPASNIMVTLNGGEYTSLSRIDGRFTFHDVPTGIYLLDVLSINQVFSQMKLKISAEEEIIDVVEFKYPGAMRMQASKSTRYDIALHNTASFSPFYALIIALFKSSLSSSPSFPFL